MGCVLRFASQKFPIRYSKVSFASLTDLNDEMTKIVEEEKTRNPPIRLVVHSRENEVYCSGNKISAFKGLWGELIDKQRHLDPMHKKPGMANLTDNCLRREGNRESQSSMVHNAGNDSYLTMLLFRRLIERALSSCHLFRWEKTLLSPKQS